MALEKYEYPASGAVTNSWLPSNYAEVSSWQEDADEGISTLQSSGKKRYRYETGVIVVIHRRVWRRVIASEWSSYKSFRSAVGGAEFKFTDADGAAHTVTFEIFMRSRRADTFNTFTWGDLLREEL